MNRGASNRAVEAVLAETARVTAVFGEAGHRLYLVGGVVRDLLLGRALSSEADLDLTTDATPAEIKALVGPWADALWLQGERFGTVGALLDGREYEITTHRSEQYVADSRKPAVAFSDQLEEDLSRRDFTVNAMAIALPDGELIDPFGGRADLEHGRLRTPLDPEVSFTDDPLRMLRAARFVAGYDLAPTATLVRAMVELGSRMAIVSVERIRDELDKLLGLPMAAPGLDLLAAANLIDRFLPEAVPTLASGRGSVVDRLPAAPDVRLAALVYGSELEVVAERLHTLRYSGERRRAILAILRATDALVSGEVGDDAGLRRWVASTGAAREWARSLAVVLGPEHHGAVERSHELEARLADELGDLGVPLAGEDVMALLGLPEGPAIGEAIAYLQELRFEQGPLDPDTARAHLVAWWRARATG